MLLYRRQRRQAADVRVPLFTFSQAYLLQTYWWCMQQTLTHCSSNSRSLEINSSNLIGRIQAVSKITVMLLYSLYEELRLTVFRKIKVMFLKFLQSANTIRRYFQWILWKTKGVMLEKKCFIILFVYVSSLSGIVAIFFSWLFVNKKHKQKTKKCPVISSVNFNMAFLLEVNWSCNPVSYVC